MGKENFKTLQESLIKKDNSLSFYEKVYRIYQNRNIIENMKEGKDNGC